jgi:hypothetical protein
VPLGALMWVALVVSPVLSRYGTTHSASWCFGSWLWLRAMAWTDNLKYGHLNWSSATHCIQYSTAVQTVETNRCYFQTWSFILIATSVSGSFAIQLQHHHLHNRFSITPVLRLGLSRNYFKLGFPIELFMYSFFPVLFNGNTLIYRAKMTIKE